jgi:hypothetical protein
MPPLEDRDFKIVLPTNGGISFCLLGSTRAGKSTFLKHLLEKYFDKHFKVLMSNSIHNPIYNDVEVDVKSPVYHGKLVNEAYMINKKTDNKYEMMMILDDVVSAKFDRDLLKLLAIYRNSNLSAIVSIQSPVLLNSATRGNLNVVMLGSQNSEEQVEKIIKMYLNSYLTGRNMTEKIMEYKRLTADYHCIVINNLDGEVYRTKLKLGK